MQDTMIREYRFFDGGTIRFDDKRTVGELLRAAFDEFGFTEPFGMDIVTLYQPAFAKGSYTGWFTTDKLNSCAKEIEKADDLYFAYCKPGVFYFAEGGWGHHMIKLGNRPKLEDPVAISLRFEDFHHTVVIAGKFTFGDIIRELNHRA